MGIAFTDIMQKVWKHLIGAGMTEAGAAGMMGNLYSESGIIPNRVEMLCLQRLREHGRYYTDAVYTAFVDDGTINRAEFLNPLPGRQYGYGLCQWTSPSRKAGLYDLCKSQKVSIGDLGAQLDYLVQELKTKYTGVWKILTSTSEILTASNRVLIEFESPADTGTAVREIRYGYSKQFYDRYAKAGDMMSTKIKTEAQASNAVINTAAAEEGYLEKTGNSSLNSKTGNAGSANYTKYWRDILPEWQGQPWCAVFISWVFMQTFGLEMAKKLLKHWPFTYCPTLASMTTNRTPKKGSIALFYKGDDYAHTELVIAVTSTTITTIGGNTSAGSSVVPNGGGVFRKTYKRAELSSLNKYFMPDYSAVIGKTTAASTAKTKVKEIATSRVGNCTITLGQYIQGNRDPEIKTIQILLNAKGYKGKDGKALAVDGELGDNTAYAIEQLQRKAGMKNISFGTVAAKTWELLLK